MTEGAGPATGAEPEDWMWLLDLERAVALAIGRCLGGMLQGPPPSVQEKTAEFWLCNPLLRNGLEMDFEQLGRVNPQLTPFHKPTPTSSIALTLQWPSRSALPATLQAISALYLILILHSVTHFTPQFF